MDADLCRTCRVPLGDTYGRTPEGYCTAHGASGVDNGWEDLAPAASLAAALTVAAVVSAQDETDVAEARRLMGVER
jgi:hypothetical protein